MRRTHGFILIISILFNFGTARASAACLEHGVPPADLPVNSQQTFLMDVSFEAEFADCSEGELLNLQALLLADLAEVRAEYAGDSKGKHAELTNVAANLKSSLALVRLARLRRAW